jgi:tRNA (cmo5U34)-methyltransferase
MDLVQPFRDAAAVARYAEDAPRRVPGYADLHRMAMLLLAERAGATAKILVVGAGGGLELKAFAEGRPDWRFVGIDPSAEMLDLARRTLGPLAARVDLREGDVGIAPQRLFDGATCLLTLHFLDRDRRLHTLREIRRRLAPGARLVVAHHSRPTGADARRWLARAAAFADDADPVQASAAAAAMAERLPILSTEEDEALLRYAGFAEVELFYAGLSLRGWVAAAA